MEKSCECFKAHLASVVADLTPGVEALQSIRSAFLDEMRRGWEAGKGAGAPADKSSLKMLTSHVAAFTAMAPSGVYYAVDLGGSNLRVLRVSLQSGCKPEVEEVRQPIPESVTRSSATAESLFDFIASTAKTLTDRHQSDITEARPLLPVGFTFSFPMSQSSVASGKLIEWTKGFMTSGCVGKDPAALLVDAFKRIGAPLSVVALCNDTVGTLMTCAYEFEGCPSCRVGVILGTGTNAAYIDPQYSNIIVNIEWGAFNHKEMHKTRFDLVVDAESPNPGKQALEKMVSGMYLGAIASLAYNEVMDGLCADCRMDQTISIDSGALSDLLADRSSLTLTAQEILGSIGEAVLDRSADYCAAALAAVIDKTLNGRPPSGDGSVMVTVGIDGSLYNKGHRYGERLSRALTRVAGEEFSSKVRFVRSTDGSGVGAAVIAATVVNSS